MREQGVEGSSHQQRDEDALHKAIRKTIILKSDRSMIDFSSPGDCQNL
jgi:hypothetical protein